MTISSNEVRPSFDARWRDSLYLTKNKWFTSDKPLASIWRRADSCNKEAAPVVGAA